MTDHMRDHLEQAARGRANDHARLLDVAGRWEAVSAEQKAEIARLKAENTLHRNANLVRAVLHGYGDVDEVVSDIINAEGFDKVPWMVAEKAIVALRDESTALRALVSWIDGMCVDCADHMEIRAGINRYRAVGIPEEPDA